MDVVQEAAQHTPQHGPEPAAEQTQRDGGTHTQAMLAVGERARAAARAVALSDPERKARAIGAMAAAIDAQHGAILEANARDLTNAEAAGITPAFQDRLRLDATRLEAIAGGLRAIAAQDDPVGAELARWRQPNGLDIARVRTPLGVIGVIYESRPNVTADAGALCLKSGNAVILRGGSDSFYSSRALHACLVAGLTSEGLPADAIQIVPTTDRAAVGDLLSGLNGTVDVIVPRGGRSLVERVQKEARVPVFSHLDGVCHVYVHEAADLEMAREVLLNAKLRRTGICGAAETVLIDKAIAGKAVAELAGALLEAGCEVRGDAASRAIDARIVPASPEDWPAEYLAPIIAMRVVGGMNEAIDHISTYGSAHTESIITGDPQAAEQFLAQVDSAIVMHNASTQFADGGEFGMGAEIGIATGRMHARGPVGAAQLTTFKYVVRGVGQVRPA